MSSETQNNPNRHDPQPGLDGTASRSSPADRSASIISARARSVELASVSKLLIGLVHLIAVQAVAEARQAPIPDHGSSQPIPEESQP